MKKKVAVITLAILIPLVSAYLIIKSRDNKPVTKTEKTYLKPEIGMEFTDFYSLCVGSDGLTKDDDLNRLQSKSGEMVTYKLQFNEKRAQKNCWGTFTFINGKLDSIFQ